MTALSKQVPSRPSQLSSLILSSLLLKFDYTSYIYRPSISNTAVKNQDGIVVVFIDPNELATIFDVHWLEINYSMYDILHHL